MEVIQLASSAPLTIEWVVAVDNSGSMSVYTANVCELLALVFEFFCKVEHRFSVATFGRRTQGSQRVLKRFEEPFTRFLGQAVFDELRYIESSNPVTGLDAIARRVWGGPLPADARRHTFRVALMVTDGETLEEPRDFAAITEEFSCALAVIHMVSSVSRNSERSLGMQGLLSEVTNGLHQVLATDTAHGERSAKELLVIMPDLIDAVFRRIGDIVTGDGRSHSVHVSSEVWDVHPCRDPSLIPQDKREAAHVSDDAVSGSSSDDDCSGADDDGVTNVLHAGAPAGGDAEDASDDASPGSRPSMEAPPAATTEVAVTAAHQLYPVDAPVAYAAVEGSADVGVCVSAEDGQLPGCDMPAVHVKMHSGEFVVQLATRRQRVESMCEEVRLLQSRLALERRGACAAASRLWAAGVVQRAGTAAEVAEVLQEAVFVNNRFTRWRADFRGPRINLPNFVRKLATNPASLGKVFDNRIGGGRPMYSVVLVIDASMSVQGDQLDASVSTLMIMLTALMQIGVEHVSVVVYGSCVRVVRVPTMPWDGAAQLILLHNLFADTATGSADATAVHVALDLLGDASARGPKFVFVLTDGQSSCSLDLACALLRAEEEGVDVVGLSVGLEASMVPRTYRRWATVPAVTFLPSALRALFDATVTDGNVRVGGPGAEDSLLKQRLQLTSVAQSLEEVFAGGMHRAVSDCGAAFQRECEWKLSQGTGPGTFLLYIMFAVDVTGSMQPYIGSVREKLQDICRTICADVAAKHPSVVLSVHFAVLGFRDIADGGAQFERCDFQARDPPASREMAREQNEADAARVSEFVRVILL
jgi:hypothetical protein